MGWHRGWDHVLSVITHMYWNGIRHGTHMAWAWHGGCIIELYSTVNRVLHDGQVYKWAAVRVKINSSAIENNMKWKYELHP
jgi:hypothetical protein